MNITDCDFNNQRINDYCEDLKKAIDKALYQTAPQERNDLEQEILLKIIEKSNNLTFKENAPSFWSFFQ